MDSSAIVWPIIEGAKEYEPTGKGYTYIVNLGCLVYLDRVSLRLRSLFQQRPVEEQVGTDQ